MRTNTTGQNAEAAVADLLERQDYKILDRNWRTRWCEIDIIAQKDDVIYFVEVKYRGSEAQGSGLEYIGPQKIRQMKFAVRFWSAHNRWDGNCRIIGAEVAGDKFQTIDLVEIY